MASFDAATLEVLWTRLTSSVDEAAAALVRASFSTLVRESHDFSCVLTDQHGDSTVQATRSIPSFIGTLPRTVKHFLAEFSADEIRPDDVYITNDIYQGTGHLPDISVAKPIFHFGKLVGFAASTAHAPDIGGKIRSPEPREVFEEGFQIPIMKLMDEGRLDTTLIKLLRKNVRVPDLVVGDLWAQLAALDLMEKRVLGLMSEYCLETLDDLAQEIQSRSETAMRQALREIPDGTYRAALETDGLEVPVHLEAAVTIDGDEAVIDFTGTSPQVDRAINVAMCYTFAYTLYGLKTAVSPNVPNNEGTLRPVTVTAPTGSILNPTFPAAGGSRVLVGHYLPVLLFRALAKVIPKAVTAGAGSPLWGMNHSGVDDAGHPFANMFFFNGGMGANYRADGVSCLSWPSNVSYTPIEVSERIAPLRFHHKRLRPNSGGDGEYRGGLGQEILVENLSDRKVAVSFLAERTKTPAPGIEGGQAGATGEIQVNGEAVDPKRQYVLERGDRVLLRTPGGGGYGDPAVRDAAARERDRELGFVS